MCSSLDGPPRQRCSAYLREKQTDSLASTYRITPTPSQLDIRQRPSRPFVLRPPSLDTLAQWSRDSRPRTKSTRIQSEDHGLAWLSIIAQDMSRICDFESLSPPPDERQTENGTT